MSRIYTVIFDNVAVTAAQDLYELLAGSANPIVLHRLTLTQNSEIGDAQDEQLRVTIKRVTGAPTSGSGGSAPTPRPVDQGDAAAAFTAEVNNTTQLSGGTSVTLHSEAWNVRAGMDYFPAPEQRFTFQISTRCVASLDAAPADSVSMHGTAVIEELT